LKTEQIQYKNHKSNQLKSKPQKTTLGSSVFGSFLYSTIWFG